MNFRRFSLSVDPIDLEIDELMKTLYPPHEEIEKKCHKSLKEDKFGLDLVVSPRKDQVGSIGQILEKTTAEVVEELPLEYFTPDYDPVAIHLQEISSWGDYDITKFMMKIEDTDTNKDVIISHLTSMIDANYDDLMECMQEVQNIHLDLVQTEMQIKNARMKIKSANDILLGGSIKINELGQRRDKLKNILSVIGDLKSMKDIHSGMVSKITTGDVGEAANDAKRILEKLNVGSCDFRALQAIAENIGNSVLLIRQKSDKALKRICCRKFTNNEYTSIINAYLTLDHITHLHNIGVESREDELSDDDFYFDTYGCMDGLSQRIHRFHLEDIDACLHSAVIEYIYLSQQKKQKAAEEISVAGAYIQMNAGEIVDLAEVPLHLLYKQLTPDLLPLCVIRSCELLADIVHTHFMISQWHKNPFDPRNEDINFLHQQHANVSEHRKSAESDSESDSYDDHEEEEAEHMGDLNQNEAKKRDIRLAVALSSMQQSRVLLWQELVRALTNMLQIATFTSSTKLEDFVSMLWALQIMMKLGKEFCGSESGVLHECIQEKSDQFFKHFHEESFQVVRMMIEAELWHNIPWFHGEHNGAIGGLLSTAILRESFTVSIQQSNQEATHSPKQFGRRASLHASFQSLEMIPNENEPNSPKKVVSESKKTESILSSFVKIGNPFHLINNQNHDSEGGFSQDHQVAIGKLLTFETIGANLWDAFLEEKRKPAKKGKDSGAGMVVTQAILNGISKYSVKYIDMMSLMPASSLKIFENLCHLYNYYICAVFHGFVPKEDKDKLTTFRSKLTSPPPDSLREFEALKGFVDEIYEVTSAEDANYIALHENTSSQFDNEQSLQSLSNSGHGSNSNIVVHQNIVYPLRTPSIIAESDSSNMFSLSEKIIAAESCWCIAQMFSEFKPVLNQLLPQDEWSKCLEYFDQFSMVAGQIRAFVYKTLSISIVHNSIAVQNIIDCSWDAKKLRDQPHDWVAKLVECCKSVWEYMMMTDQFADSSSMVREQLWLEICQACFDIVIEGYSKVRKCSAEGRASMTLDVFALHEGLNSVHLCRPPRGKHYVDNYLRAFYLNEDDMMNWVQENWQSYSYRHIHALLSQTLTSMLNNKRLRDAIAVIDSLYEIESSPSATRFGSMIRQRLAEESRIGSIIGNKLRR